MRTENYKHGVVSILLVFALVFSMILVTPLATAANLIYNPGGTTITTIQGGTFLIRHTLEWTNPTENGAYTVTIAWDCYDNNEDENFTLVSASAYFDLNNDNVDDGLPPILAVVTLNSAQSPADPNDTRYVISVACPAANKDPRDGQFNVDVWMSASGAGGVPHIATDNHPILWQMGGVIIVEPAMQSFDREIITIDIDAWLSGIAVKGRATAYSRDVNPPPAFIMYGTGDLPPIGIGERYNDDPDNGAVFAWAGSSTCRNGKWNNVANPDPHLDNLFHAAMQWMVPGATNVLWYEGHNVYVDTTAASQLVAALTSLGYTITAVSTEPITPAVLSGYDIVVIPGLQEGAWYTGGEPTLLLGSEVDAMVGFVESGGGLIVMEFGDYGGQFIRVQNKILKGVGFDWCFQSDTLSAGPPDNYTPAASYWSDYIVDVDSSTSIGSMYQASTGKTTVGLYSPSSLTPWPTLDVTVDITPDARAAENGDTVTYTVTVTNTGDAWDNYNLSVSDSPFSWGLALDDDNLAIYDGDSASTTLSVTIPGDAVHCNLDTITVTATSYWDDTVSGSDTATAHCTVGIKNEVVMLEPTWQENYPCNTLYFKVAIKNIGVEDDSYDVTIEDTAGWGAGLQVETMKLYPTDDSYVENDDPTANHGDSGNLYVGLYRDTNIQRSFLKFDLSAVPGEILSAKIGVYHYYTFDPVVDFCKAGEAWTEDTVNWNNQPAIGEVIYSTVGTTNGWKIADLGSWAEVEQELDDVLSIAIVENDESISQYYSITFSSKETSRTWQKPYLEVTYSDPAADPITSTQVSVPAKENKVIDICVHIPITAKSLEDDIITVTSVSKTNPDVIDSDSATAHNAGLRCVDVWVTPPNQDGYRDPLTYIVEIHNNGQLNDKYNLSAYDELGWPLHIEPQEIWLKPSHTAQAALSVTIPAQTENCTTDTITVEVVGNLSSGSFTDPYNSQNSATVTAHCMEVLGVDVGVYPSIHQTGHPGSELTWLVTVTNTGNATDTYDLILSQLVYDETANSPYDNWLGGFSQDMVTLDPGDEASIILNLDIPDNLRTCVQNLIDVEVTSRTDEMISDIEWVTAQVLELKPRIPQGEIKLQAVAGIVAIDIWPTEHDFGVFNEMDIKWTDPDYFTIRNVGNVDVTVWIEGTDAVSKPGEPAAKWTLGDGSIGVDTYALWRTSGGKIVDTVTTEEKLLTELLEPHDETYFDLEIQAPSTFTAPAKMWMKVLITARKIHY